jgi:hypothetical protein
MELPSSDEHVGDRPRKPHWKKTSFWKTFGTMLVVYLVIRVLINLALDWSSGPVEPGLGSEPTSPSVAPADQPSQGNQVPPE